MFKSILTAISGAFAAFNKIMTNITRSQDMEAGANKVKIAQHEAHDEARDSSDRIDREPDRDRLRRPDGNDPG